MDHVQDKVHILLLESYFVMFFLLLFIYSCSNLKETRLLRNMNNYIWTRVFCDIKSTGIYKHHKYTNVRMVNGHCIDYWNTVFMVQKVTDKTKKLQHSLHCMMATVNVDCERAVHQRVVWSRRVLIKLPCVTAPLYRGTNNYNSNILLTKSKQQSKQNLDAYIPPWKIHDNSKILKSYQR